MFYRRQVFMEGFFSSSVGFWPAYLKPLESGMVWRLLDVCRADPVDEKHWLPSELSEGLKFKAQNCLCMHMFVKVERWI
jgi:hypothetical protein